MDDCFYLCRRLLSVQSHLFLTIHPFCLINKIVSLVFGLDLPLSLCTHTHGRTNSISFGCFVWFWFECARCSRLLYRFIFVQHYFLSFRCRLLFDETCDKCIHCTNMRTHFSITVKRNNKVHKKKHLFVYWHRKEKIAISISSSII